MYIGSFISSIGQEINVRTINGIFTRYVFTKKENVPLVKKYVNIFIDYIRKYNPISSLELLGDDIEVTAEYNYYKQAAGFQPSQDFQIKEKNKVLYLEVQTEIDTDNPLFGRAMVYYALSFTEAIGQTYEKKNQLWLCAICEDNIVNNDLAFEEYSFMGNTTHKLFPKTSSITVVDLRKLSEINNDEHAIHFARYLLSPTYKLPENLSDISQKLQENFQELKKDKERLRNLEEFNLAEYEGIREGRKEGIKEGMEKERIKNLRQLYSTTNDIDLLLKVFPEYTIDELKEILNL